MSAALASRSAASGFPWGTFLINVIGSLLLGLLAGLLNRQQGPESWRLFLGVGVLGGFTTFSTFSLETLQMIQQGRGLQATLYIIGSVLFGLAGCWIALSLAKG